MILLKKKMATFPARAKFSSYLNLIFPKLVSTFHFATIANKIANSECVANDARSVQEIGKSNIISESRIRKLPYQYSSRILQSINSGIYFLIGSREAN